MGKLTRTASTWSIDGTAVTVTAAELNAAAGTGLDATELGYLNGVTAGTATASKAVVLDGSKGISTITSATITTLTCPNFAGAEAHAGVLTPTGGIAAAGGFTASPRSIHTGDQPAVATTDGTDATPSTTETYVSEVFVPCNMTITGVAVFNGSNVTGNVQVALATSAGAPIAAAKSAATAGSGTDAYQRIPFATPYAALGPATYYIQVQYSSATARYNAHTVGNHGVLVQTGQVFGTLTSFTPPTTFVTAVGNIAGLY